MSKALIIKLIMHYSLIYGVDPHIALAVAQVESGLNPNTVGAIYHEIGLYQVRSEFVKDFTRQQLFDPAINIQVGIRILAEAKRTCKHQKNNDWLVCYNYGRTAALKVKHPELFPYVKKVNLTIAMQEIN